MAIEKVPVPDIGGAEGAEVIELLVAVGDTITVDQSLIVLESDKASMEIPSTCAGKVVELLVAEGDALSEGAPIIAVEVAGEEAPSEPANDSANDDLDSQAADGKSPREDDLGAKQSKGRTPEPISSPQDSGTAQEPASQTPEQTASKVTVAARANVGDGDSVYAGPAVRKLARELGVPLEQVPGTGPQRRIVKEDVHRYVQGAINAPSSGGVLPAVPTVDFAKFGAVEIVARSKLDHLTGDNMQCSWLNVPHVTQFDDADITELEAFRKGLADEAKSRGVRLSPVPFILKACAVVLRDNPKVNSSLSSDGDSLVYKQYIHIGVAVDTPAGLMVPVIRDVDQKGIWDIADEVMVLASKAKERKLMPNDMQGGTFTVSSLGAIGGRGFTPIVNTPEVAILGVSKASVQPHWDGHAFSPRNLLPLSLSYDHRVLNGGDSGRFLTQLVALLGDVRRLVL